jgi:predicted ATPase/class 3 adenylate cyclase
MAEYPSGTVAFLFTDIEGSTRRWETQRELMAVALERHFTILREAVTTQNGVLFKSIGDAAQAAFPTVAMAVAAVVSAQGALRGENWGNLGPLRVRMAIHAGEATPSGDDYLAPCLNRLARVLSVGYGEQILLTETARTLIADSALPGYGLLDLGAHRLKDLLSAEHIFQLTGPGLPLEFPPLKSLDRQLHNLPAQPTALIGREPELAALRDMLVAPESRQVTLVGPGGVGKTRIALQAAVESLEAFPDGVWWVPLAAVSDPGLVAQAIAAPLGVREVAGESLLETLGEHLRTRRLLLLLDNLEQVVDAGPLLADLLTTAPQLQILATSRAPLGILAEREFSVAPLPLPARGRASAEATLASPAVRLFVERAQAVKPEFALDVDNADDVAAICRRLDGLPLAIELAAARIRILPPRQLLARLDCRLKLLTGGSRDLPPRQQTLRAAIAWSYDLLDEAEQSLFACLAIFAGGCTLEAAERIGEGTGTTALDVLDGLDSLVQKSLLRQEDGADGEVRFSMLETIREYGRERLDASGDAETVAHAHAGFYVSLAEEAEPQLTGPQQGEWLDRLETEHDNLRAALDWLAHPGEEETQLRLAAALWRFWWMRGYLSEGRRWLNRILTAADGLPAAARAKALSGAGILAEAQGDYEHATVLHEQALALSRQIGDRRGIAASLTDLGIVARFRGDHPLASQLHEEALTLWRELRDDRGMASSFHELGRLALDRGDYRGASTLLEQSLALCRAAGEASALGSILESLGMLAFYEEDYERAVTLYEESLAVWRSLDDSRMIGHALANLGEAVHYQGNLDRAESLYQESLVLFRELGSYGGAAFALRQLGKAALERGDARAAAEFFSESLGLRQAEGETTAIIESLEGLAEVAAVIEDTGLGVRLLGATTALRASHSLPVPTSYRREQERVLAGARATLGEMTFSLEWARGQAMAIDQAIVEAGTVRHTLAQNCPAP